MPLREYPDSVCPSHLPTGSPKDKLNVSFGSNDFPCAPFFIIIILGTGPLNHRFGKGDETSLPSIAETPVHSSTERREATDVHGRMSRLTVPASQHCSNARELSVGFC